MRQQAILNIISENKVCTQEELQDMLRQNGFETTQATISRDIRELRLVKKSDGKSPRFYHKLPEIRTNEKITSKLFAQSVVSIENAGNIVCIKCRNGTAGAVCVELDENPPENTVGTIAGDDTIFLLMNNVKIAKKTKQNLIKMLESR